VYFGAETDFESVIWETKFQVFGELPLIWPEGNVTLGYLSTLNTWTKRFNFLLLTRIVLFDALPLCWLWPPV
jgi:hypothetical protein